MKTLNCIQCQFTSMLILLAAVPSIAFESSRAVAEAAEMNVIATNAFRILRDVPNVGLERSAVGLEQIIETHRRLSLETNVSQRQISMVLADTVAYAIFTEIHRSEVARLGTDQRMTPKSIPFAKKTAVRLWKANWPDFPTAIRKALQGYDTVTSFVATQSCEEDVLSGEMPDKAPLETIQPRLQELQEKTFHPAAFGRDPSPDEQLMYALDKCQAFRDLDVVISLYEKSTLPGASVSLRAAIDGELKPSAGKRLDDGMEVTAFKVWLTFRRYYPQGTSADPLAPIEEYYLKQALALAPFMNDTSSLPETAKKVLSKIAISAALGQRERNSTLDK